MYGLHPSPGKRPGTTTCSLRSMSSDDQTIRLSDDQNIKRADDNETLGTAYERLLTARRKSRGTTGGKGTHVRNLANADDRRSDDQTITR